MELDHYKIKEAIVNLKSSMDYMECFTDEMRKMTHGIVPIQHEIKEFEDLISKSGGSYSENILAQINKKIDSLKLSISSISEIDLMFNQMLDDMTDFVQQYSFNPEKLKQPSHKEIVFMYDLDRLCSKTSLNQCRKMLTEFISTTSECHFIELINSEFKLTGYNRFYLKNNIVMSKYCCDWKSLIPEVLRNFPLLLKIIHKHHSEIKGTISPMQLLKAIILHYNRISIDPADPLSKFRLIPVFQK